MTEYLLTFAIALVGCILLMFLLHVCIFGLFYEVEGVKFLSRKRAERYARLIHEIREQMVELDGIKRELVEIKKESEASNEQSNG